MKVIAPKAKGNRDIVAPRPQSTITAEHIAKAFGATSMVASGEGSNPLHSWQAARQRLVRMADDRLFDQLL
jgi:hypothetical protein